MREVNWILYYTRFLSIFLLAVKTLINNINLSVSNTVPLKFWTRLSDILNNALHIPIDIVYSAYESRITIIITIIIIV